MKILTDWGEFRDQKRDASKARRAANRDNGLKAIESFCNKSEGSTHTVHNNGAHIVVMTETKLVDYWPGTGKWSCRTGNTGRGIASLLKHLSGK